MPRILLVDDAHEVLDLEKLILSEAGHDVLVAEEALLALDLLQLYEVDLIIVDVQMPRFDGFQFVSTIKNNPGLLHIPIAFCTSAHDKDNVERAAKLGADFYLVKPIERNKFLEKITAFFAKRPSKIHPKIEFQAPNLTDVKIHQTVQLVSISDLGVEILINQELEDGQIIELNSSICHEELSDNPLLKVLWIKSHEDGLRRAFLMFL